MSPFMEFRGKKFSRTIIEGSYVVQMTSSSGRYYFSFDSCESFYYWFRGMSPCLRTFNEVVGPSFQKFKLDIDHRDIDLNFLRRVLFKLFDDMGVSNPDILIYDIETSYHVVVSNYSFPSHVYCLALARELSKFVPIDQAVYSRIQHFRTEGSTKYGQSRWKKLIGGSGTVEDFSKGAISDLRGTRLLRPSLYLGRSLTREYSTKSSLGPFSLRWKRGSLEVFNRNFPSYCETCCRVHERENPYVFRGKFYCRRS